PRNRYTNNRGGAHMTAFLPCVRFSTVAYIAKCAMYAPPTKKRLSTQFVVTTLVPHLIRSSLRDEVVGTQQRLERARVGPPSIQHTIGQGSFFHVLVVDVGYFQLTTPRGTQPSDSVEDRRVIHVDADHREARLWFFGLFLNTNDPVAIEHGHAEPFGIGNFPQDNAGALRPLGEFLAGADDVSLNDVVTQDHADRPTVRKMLRQAERIRDPAFSLLIGVVDVLEAKILATAKKPQEVTRAVPSRNQENVRDACIHQGLDGIKDHRSIVNRQQVFVRHPREREQA